MNPYNFFTIPTLPPPSTERTRQVARRRRDRKADLERGARLRMIREALDYSQFDFVDKLNQMARTMGLPATYRYYTVSRIESGALGFEDAAIYLALDPEHRGWDWFIWGETRKPPMADPALYKKVSSAVIGINKRRRANGN